MNELFDEPVDIQVSFSVHDECMMLSGGNAAVFSCEDFFICTSKESPEDRRKLCVSQECNPSHTHRHSCGVKALSHKLKLTHIGGI